jgi:hypothetical protein
VGQSPASKDMNTEAEEATVFEAVTRRQPVKIEQTEKFDACCSEPQSVWISVNDVVISSYVL